MQYGLEVTERDPRIRAVLAISCRFCLKFGRKPQPDAKRMGTNNLQVFKAPFRTEVYKRHHATVHREQWQKFLACSVEQKAIFSDAAVNHARTLMARFESEGALTLTFNRDIAEVIIGDLLFDSDDEATQPTRERAIAILKPLEDAAVGVDASDSAAREQDLNRVQSQDHARLQVQDGSRAHLDGGIFLQRF